MGGGPTLPSTRSRSIAAVIAASLVGLVVVLWLDAASWERLLVERLVVPGALAAGVLLALVGTSAIAHAAIARRPADDPGIATHIVLGLPLFGTLVFLVALVTTAPPAMGTVLALAMAAGARHVASRTRRRTRPVGDGAASPDRSATAPAFAAFAAAGAIAVAAGIALLWAELPPVSIDEVAYHLAVPEAWLREGRAIPLPLLSHSYFPFGVESAHLPALALLGHRGAIAAHLVHLGVSGAVLVILVRWIARGASRTTALVAAAAIATSPTLVASAGVVWNEWPLVGLALVLVSRLEAVTLTRGPPATTAQPTLALAVAGGLLCKYTFAPLLLATLLAAAVALRRDRAGLGILGRALAVGSALGSVFFVKNVLWCGDPVAPFLSAHAPRVDQFVSSTGRLDQLRRYLFDDRMMDESLGITIVALAIALGAAWIWLEPFTRALAVTLGVSILVLARVAPSGRLLLPFLAVLAALGARSLDTVLLSSPAPRAVARAVLLGAAGLQLVVAAFFLESRAPFALLRMSSAGPVISESDFLALRPEAFHASVAWLDAELPPDARLLLLGLPRTYGFSHRVRGGGNFDGERIAAYLDASDAGALRERLRADGLTHIALFESRLEVGTAPPRGFSGETRTVLSPHASEVLRDLLLTHTKPMGATDQVKLFELE